MKTGGGPLGVNSLRGRLEKICRGSFRSGLAPAQYLAGIRSMIAWTTIVRSPIDLGQKYTVAVGFLRGAHHAAGAVDAHHLPEYVLHGPSQSLLHAGGTEDTRDDCALGPDFFLVLCHVAQQETKHQKKIR